MARGTSTRGDLPVSQLRDGTDTARLFNTYSELVKAQNDQRTGLMNLLGFPTTLTAESVLQTWGVNEFEAATEFGDPVGARLPLDSYLVGFPFKWYDLATRWSWQFLADATKEQTDAIANSAVEADNRLKFKQVMGALFSNTPRQNEHGNIVHTLYNGDGIVPPPHDGETFDGSHNHFMTTGTTVLESADVDRLAATVTEHGFGQDSARGRLLLFAHRDQVDVMRSWRVATGARHDFIPSDTAPPFLTTETLVGDKPPASFGAVSVAGSYGSAWIAESSLIPKGYVAAVVSNGPDSAYNPIAVREHPTASLRGMRLVGGTNSDYPLSGSFFVRGIGTGVRLRGAAAIMQVTAGSYAVPSAFQGV